MNAPVTHHRGPSTRILIVAGLVLAAALALLVAPRASSSPDGLEKVAADHQLDAGAKPSATDGSPLAGYAVGGRDSALSTGIAGVAGIAATFAVGYGLFRLAARRRSARADPIPPTGAGIGGTPATTAASDDHAP